ncbi:glycosyltransferase family 39 protein [Candidatus Gottesmanbacteria bacterium]|nr:glycosyltransferase family 39 protein [Candidatus Gottesmanbacteria bacterium]
MELLVILIIALGTFFTRIINLLKIPIFTDEAIYIRWAQIGLADPAHRYISLTDGKQPLLIWLMYPMLKIFSDPLFAGRFVSVLSGIFTVIGMYFLTRELFGKKEAILASLIYIFSPFTLLYDRLALYDSLLAGFGVWSLYLSVLLVRKNRLDVALLLGITTGLGVLTKSSALFFLFLLPFSLFLFDFKAEDRVKKLFILMGLSLISFVIAQIMYNSLRLSPWFYIIRQKNYSFVLTFSEFLKKPFELFMPNLHGLVPILFTYLTIPILLVIIYGLVRGILTRDKKILYLFFWFVIPYLALAAIGKVIFPRFILFMVIPLFVIASKSILDITSKFGKNNKLMLITVLFILTYPIYQSVLLIYNPVDAEIPISDKNQLFNDWPSGYGAKEVINFINEKAMKEKVVLGTEGTFGLNPAVYEIYLKSNKNIDIRSYWPVGEVPKDLLESSKGYPTYLVFKETQNIPGNWPLKLIAKYRRGKGDTFLLFYQVESRDKNSLK